MISISHAPNATVQQQALCRTLLRPWMIHQWKQGSDVKALESWFKTRYSTADAVSFSTGREALYAVIRALGIGHGDEVLIQAYTCIVVPHAVIWNGAQPIYLDIDETLNIDVDRITPAITPKTKAIIVQHTFGMPANIDRIKAICSDRGILLIEDVAHAFGALYHGQPVGTFGDAAIFSFGRDKAISSTAGGMAIAKDPDVAQRLRAIEQQSTYPSLLTIKQQLLHPLIVPWCSERMGTRRWGAIMLRLAQFARLVNRVYTPSELDSKAPKNLTHRLPNAMAKLVLQQLHDHHDSFIRHRAQLANYYSQWAQKRGLRIQKITQHAVPSWLRFTIFAEHPQQIITSVRTYGYQLGNWYSSVIMPLPHDAHALGYITGSCPNAEQAARTSINLPTHIHMTQQDLVGLSAALSMHV